VSKFFSGLQLLYTRLDAKGGSSETADFDAESTSTPNVGLAAATIPAAIWTGSYFNDYDYDSTNYQSDPNLVLNDDQNSTNIFDS
jgi:hypothetical protein